MNDDRPLDCAIYVDSTGAVDELVPIVAELVGGQGACQPGGGVVRFAAGEIDVRRNPDADGNRDRAQRDRFLYSRVRLEFYPHPGCTHQDKVAALTRLLNGLWAFELPAVAACDYEAELPRHGGYSTEPLEQDESQPVA